MATRSRPYRSQQRAAATAKTRTRIVDAVHSLLVEGTFHASTVEDVAKRAGVARATLYQHFGSRLELVDALCDSLAENPALLAVRRAVELDDPRAALREFIAQSVGFWASEEELHRQLYGLATIDPAAADYVRRQRADRHGEVERLARHLRACDGLRKGVGERRAIVRLLLLTSFESFAELRGHAGLEVAEVERTLAEMAERELLR
jgi:AcrR family transcriptional regulator